MLVLCVFLLRVTRRMNDLELCDAEFQAITKKGKEKQKPVCVCMRVRARLCLREREIFIITGLGFS
jgi:hypothetical protein